MEMMVDRLSVDRQAGRWKEGKGSVRKSRDQTGLYILLLAFAIGLPISPATAQDTKSAPLAPLDAPSVKDRADASEPTPAAEARKPETAAPAAKKPEPNPSAATPAPAPPENPVLPPLPIGELAEIAPFPVKDGETVLFFGDSITQGGTYVEYIDAYLRTRFPERRIRVINAGISSETISGTSEPDHTPRRPNAQDRFARDVAAHRPNWLVACFGMNDGNYFPFDHERFATYQQGVARLLERAREEAGVQQVVLLTPPPFDPYRRQSGDPNAVEFGYKFPFIGYDDVLDQFSRHLLTLRSPTVLVADVHAISNEHLRRRRQARVSFFLAGDAVHPNPTGHWLMAQCLLEAWQAPATVDDIRITVERNGQISGPRSVTAAKIENGVLSFGWTGRLPMPIDPRWDADSIALERVNDRFNRLRLQVTGLTAPQYDLAMEGTVVSSIDRSELAKGIDLVAQPVLAINRRSLELLSAVQERQQMFYRKWRQAIAADKDGSPGVSVIALAAAEKEWGEKEEAMRVLCRPALWRMELKPSTAR